MFKNGYNKSLTIVLIIVIIVIVGLLIFFGIDLYRRYYIESETGKVVEEFQDHVNQISTSNPDNDSNSGNVTPDVNINDLYQDNTGNTNSSGSSGVTYMGYTVIGTIEIPAIDIEYHIIPDDEASLNSLNVAIVKLYPSSTGLNEIGNTVLAGHNYRNGTFFSNNKRLQNGDKIYITDESGQRIEYEIYRKYTTGTGDSSYMNRDTDGKREISLTTCTDDTTERLIIWAREVEN